MKVGTEKAAMGAVEVGVACWLTKYNQLGARLFISSAAEGKAIECYKKLSAEAICAVNQPFTAALEAAIYRAFCEKELPKLQTLDAVFPGAPCTQCVKRCMEQSVKEIQYLAKELDLPIPPEATAQREAFVMNLISTLVRQ